MKWGRAGRIYTLGKPYVARVFETPELESKKENESDEWRFVIWKNERYLFPKKTKTKKIFFNESKEFFR